MSCAKTGVKQELNRLSISRGFSAEDLNITAYNYLGQWMHWLILASILDQELYAIWNSASISTKNAFGLC